MRIWSGFSAAGADSLRFRTSRGSPGLSYIKLSRVEPWDDMQARWTANGERLESNVQQADDPRRLIIDASEWCRVC